MMTSTIRKFGVGVASLALVASAVAPAFAAPDDDVLPGLGNATMDRLSGADRIGTALKVANHAFKYQTDRPTTVYITNADDAHLIDSTTAGKLTDGPIVFVKNNSYVAEAVGSALKNSTDYPSFGAFNKVVAIGGESSVSNETLALVAKKAGVAKTDRIAGKDRYETAVKIADYMYDKAMKNEDGYGRLLAGSTTNLDEVYIASGSDGHLVDSMAGGVLDGGPTLLANPDGSLSEETQAFIKKTLPKEFIALGGTSAVSDETVNNAWLIKALKNDWTDSSNIPALKKAKEEAKIALDGLGKKDSRNPGSDNFMGLKKAVSEAVRVSDVWSTQYQRVRLSANEALAAYLKANPDLTPSQLIRQMRNVTADLSGTDLQRFVANLILLYGDAVTDADASGTVKLDNTQKSSLVKGAFSLRDGKVAGFDFGSFESYPAVADIVSDAKDDLIQWWALDDVSADNISKKKNKEELSYVAIASQKETVKDAFNSDWNGSGNILTPADATKQKAAASAPLAAVKEVSAWVAEEVKKNRDDKQAKYDAAAQALRDGLDKVAPKTVLRLGGKDRYETAAYIATQYMKIYTNIATRQGASQYYLANGMAYADAIVAGQLKYGPILLIPAEGDIPAAVQATAAALPVWNTGETLAGYGIGGTKVLPEEQLKKVLNTVIKNITKKKSDKEEAKSDPYTASMVTIFQTGIKTTELMMSGSKDAVKDVDLSATEFTIKNDKDEKVTDSKVKVTWDNTAKKLKVVTAGAAKGLYTVTFKVTGKDASFKIKVVDETFAYQIKAADANKAVYTLGDSTMNISSNNQIVSKDFMLERVEDPTAAFTGALKDFVVLTSDGGVPAANSVVATAGTANGSIKVTLDLLTAKFGTYQIKGHTADGKDFNVDFEYKKPATPAEIKDTNYAVDNVTYALGTNAYDTSGKAYVFDLSNGGKTAAAINTAGVTVSGTSQVAATSQGDTKQIAGKTVLVMKDNAPAKLFTAGADVVGAVTNIADATSTLGTSANNPLVLKLTLTNPSPNMKVEVLSVEQGTTHAGSWVASSPLPVLENQNGTSIQTNIAGTGTAQATDNYKVKVRVSAPGKASVEEVITVTAA